MFFVGIIAVGMMRSEALNDAETLLHKGKADYEDKKQKIENIQKACEAVERDLNMANRLELYAGAADVKSMMQNVRGYDDRQSGGHDAWHIQKEFDEKISNHPLFVKLLTDMINEQKEKTQQEIQMRMAALGKHKQ